MIDNPADYEFVTGITNGEVVIDGGIMPARDVALDTWSVLPPLMHPKVLRGEDMAFLAECAGERNTVMEQQQAPQHSYSKKISAVQIDSIHAALTRYIRPPTDAYTNVYIKPDYVFQPARVDISQYTTPDFNLMSHNFFSLVYPDSCYVSPVSENPSPFVGDDIRAMFWDAQMTSRPVPTANTWDLELPLVPPPESNVTIQSKILRELHEANWSDPTPGGDESIYEDTGSIYMCAVGGYGYPNRYYKYSYTANSFTMNVTVPPTIQSWVSDEVTAIVFVAQFVNYVSWNGNSYVQSAGPYDLFAFPFTKTVSALGKVTIDTTDIQHVLNTISASLTERGIEEFGWQGNRFVYNRYNYILGCPLVCKLTDHTDFSSLGWAWIP